MADESAPAGALAFVVGCVKAGRCACGALVFFEDEAGQSGVVSHVHPTCSRFEAAMSALGDSTVERLPDAYIVVRAPGAQG